MMHKPPYSSDEDDYGDTAETRSIYGDINARRLVPLYEKHGVDIVWSGHIHSYERTWPLKDGKPVDQGKGVVYMVTVAVAADSKKPVRYAVQSRLRSIADTTIATCRSTTTPCASRPTTSATGFSTGSS